ncbi:MAG: twin-arginine translocation signal domain-containing protein [Candidatus Paceibacterota bacterium]
MEENRKFNNTSVESSKKSLMSRRHFLKLGIFAGAGAVLGYPKIKNEILNILDENGLKENIKSLKNFLYSNYNLNAELDISKIPSIGHSIKSESTSLAEQSEFLIWICKEITKYPLDFIKNSGLKSIYCTKALELDGTIVTSFAYGNIFFISIGLYGILDNLYASHSGVTEDFHHELFHVADRINNVEWAKLNEKGDKVYMRTWQHNLSWDELYKELTTSRPEGFADRYGLKNEGEDKATIAMMLMTDPVRAFSLAETDLVFSKKLEICKKLFKELSDGKMDEVFWKDLSLGNVGKDYWQNKK